MYLTLQKNGVKLLLTLCVLSCITTVFAAPQDPDYNEFKIPINGNICDNNYPCIASSIQSDCAVCASTGLSNHQVRNAFDDNPNTYWMSNSVATEDWCDQPTVNPEIIIDLSSSQNIEAVQLYYWQNFCGCAGDFLTTRLFISNDQFNWGNPVATFPYSAELSTKTYSNNTPIEGQFIRIQFRGCPEAWSKVTLSEVEVFGSATAAPLTRATLTCDDSYPANYLISQNVDPDQLLLESDQPSDYVYGDMLGINAGTEWDCFYGGPNNNCGENPFKKLVTHVRSFHLQEKDYQNHNFDGETGCSDCPGPTSQCTPAQRGDKGPLKVGWNGGIDLYKLRYSQWNDDGFDNIQASLEAIHLYCENGARSFPQKWWTEAEWGGNENAYNNARVYGRVFAEELCPDDADCLIRHLEVGNEPWQYRDPCFYQEILKGVIDGVKEYYESVGINDPANWPMKLLPGAFQGYRPDIDVVDASDCTLFKYCPNRYDFVGDRIPKDYIQYLDGLSVHPYAFNTSDFMMDEHPEAPASQSEMPRFKSMIHWMDHNMPGKKLFVSEYGWDSDLVGNVTQGIYLLRSTLIFGRYNVYRATMYTTRDNVGDPGSSACYNDGLYNTSGLLTDNAPPDGGRCVPNPNSKKIAFQVMEEMVQKIGDKRFMGVISESNDAYAYLIGDKDATEASHIIAWNPVRLNDATDYNGSDIYALSDPVVLDMPDGLAYTEGNIEWIDGVTDNRYDTWRVTNNDNGLALPLSGCPVLIPLNAAAIADEIVDEVEEPQSEGGICDDGIQNGDETGIDCGGSYCNLAISKQATQSCEQNGGSAQRAIDGETNGNFYESFSVSHTCWERQPWWQVDLGEVYEIDRIRLFNRTDANGDYLKNYHLLLSNEPIPSGSLEQLLENPKIESFYETSVVRSPSTIDINYQARYIRLQIEGSGFICLSEMEVIKGCEVTNQCEDAGTPCDDRDPLTVDDVWNGNCICAGEQTVTCEDAGKSCNDGDPMTTDDVWDGFCTCAGDPIAACGDSGTPCDDGDPNTFDDVWDSFCMCAGEPITFCDEAGTPCDDDDDATANDVWDGNCNCEGTVPTNDCNTRNVALNKTSTQSSINQNGYSDRAVDGNTSGNFYQDFSIALTQWEKHAWWQLDLGAVYDIETINVYNRTDADMDQLRDYHVFVSDVDFVDYDLGATKIQYDVSDFYEEDQGLVPTEIIVNRTGRYIRVQLENAGFLGIAEVEVMACNNEGPAARVVVEDEQTDADMLRAWQTPEKSREIVLFPNPTNSVLYVDLSKLAGFDAKMELYMSNGKMIETYDYQPIPNDLVHINILDYPNGTYFLKIHLTKDVVVTKQFIVMK